MRQNAEKKATLPEFARGSPKVRLIRVTCQNEHVVPRCAAPQRLDQRGESLMRPRLARKENQWPVWWKAEPGTTLRRLQMRQVGIIFPRVGAMEDDGSSVAGPEHRGGHGRRRAASDKGMEQLPPHGSLLPEATEGELYQRAKGTVARSQRVIVFHIEQERLFPSETRCEQRGIERAPERLECVDHVTGCMGSQLPGNAMRRPPPGAPANARIRERRSIGPVDLGTLGQESKDLDLAPEELQRLCQRRCPDDWIICQVIDEQ